VKLDYAAVTPTMISARMHVHETRAVCRHWFARWRLNCFLVAWHAMAHGDDETVSKQYLLEGKGEFLLAAEAAGVPISPFRRDLSTIFAKHVNVEGGNSVLFLCP